VIEKLAVMVERRNESKNSYRDHYTPVQSFFQSLSNFLSYPVLTKSIKVGKTAIITIRK
jgi:hypothetical protein